MSNYDTERDSVLRRIEKLLAIANDDRANEHEAAAAAGQAEKLMRKFNVDFSAEIGQRVKSGKDMGTEDVIATAKDNGTPAERVPTWAQWIAVEVANMHDCGARSQYTQTDKGREACIRFFGYKDDVRVAAWTFDYLVKTVNRLCKQYRTDPRYLLGGRVVMNSYRNGMASGILHTLQQVRSERVAEQQAAVASRALVVIKKEAIEEHFGEIKYRNQKTKTRVDGVAFQAGRAKGKTIDVRRGIEGNTAGQPGAVTTTRRLS